MEFVHSCDLDAAAGLEIDRRLDAMIASFEPLFAREPIRRGIDDRHLALWTGWSMEEVKQVFVDRELSGELLDLMAEALGACHDLGCV